MQSNVPKSHPNPFPEGRLDIYGLRRSCPLKSFSLLTKCFREQVKTASPASHQTFPDLRVRRQVDAGPCHSQGAITIIAWPRMAGIADCRLPIFDCWWTLEGVATPLFQSSIGNRQSAMKTWSLVAAKGRAVASFLFNVLAVEPWPLFGLLPGTRPSSQASPGLAMKRSVCEVADPT